MKMIGLILGIVGAVGATGLMGQTPEQPATQPAESREVAARAEIGQARPRPATAPATSPARLIWHGLDLSAAFVTTETSKLPDIWVESPLGSRSYEVRPDVTVIPAREGLISAAIYWIPAANRFYVQYDAGGSSTRHFYGPFEGDLNQVLTPPTSQRTERIR